MSAEARVRDLGLDLPPPASPQGNYVPWRIGGGLLFLSGVGPRRGDGTFIVGKIGAGKIGGELTVADGYEAARLCGLQLLTHMRVAVGSLDAVAGVLKVLGMVNAVPEFADHPEVINGCTDLFVDVFGDAGRPARSAVGMGSLPRQIAVEVEAIVLLR